MTRYQVRPLCSEDYEAIRQLEADNYAATFYALVDGRFAESLLLFVRDRDAGGPALASREEFLRTCVTPLRLANVETCWFTDNADTCSVGIERIVSNVGSSQLEQVELIATAPPRSFDASARQGFGRPLVGDAVVAKLPVRSGERA